MKRTVHACQYLLLCWVLPFFIGLALSQVAWAGDASLYDLPLKWTDDHGQTVGMEQWRGKAVLMSMGYTSCRKTCSVTLKKLEEFQAVLDQKKQDVEVVIVSFDPRNDTPESWAAYRKQHGLNRGNWHFLSGSERDTRRLSQFLGLSDFWSLEGHILHDFKISVLGKSGQIAQQIDWQDLKKPDLLTRLGTS